MKAKRGDYCIRCGHFAPAGNELVRVYDAVEDREVWKVYHTDKSICEANIAEDRAKKARREAYQARWDAFVALFDDAEYPWGDGDSPIQIDGEVLCDTYSIYGGGSRIVIDDDYVWFCQCNSMDGDDWSLSNSDLGIAKRLPRTDELVAEARALEAERKAIAADK